MYEIFYGLKSKPFSILPDPEFLYLGKKHRVALTMLEYALMNNAGFCVITGEIGAGKTTLLRKLLGSIEDNITIGMITNTHQSFGELLDWVLSAFGIHQPGLGKVEMHQRLVDFLLEQYASNKTTLLIVDEAQNMPATTLEELRMLSNINSEKDLVLQVILAGQPDLKDTLRQPELTQFAQRISVDFHLDALNSFETCHYIQHRLVTAGATDDIFTPEACRLIHVYSGGVPRLINMLCDTALVYGFADQKKTIDVDIIEEMISERMEHSILPLANIDKRKAVVKTDNENFPWINPDGGTKGLKPVAEKKTVEKAASEIELANVDDFRVDRVSQRAEKPVTDAAKTVAPVTANSTPEDNTTEASIPEEATTYSPEKDWQAPTSGYNSEPTTGRASNTDVDTVTASIDDQIDKSEFGHRITLLALLVLVLFLSLATVSFDYEVVLPGALWNKQVAADKMNRELEHVQQPAEVMLRQTDAIRTRPGQEEEPPALQEPVAMTAEKALKASNEAEAMANEPTELPESINESGSATQQPRKSQEKEL